MPKNLTKRFYSNGYALILTQLKSNIVDLAYRKLIHIPNTYPVSSDIFLFELRQRVTKDVQIVDKVTAILVLFALLMVLGTLVAPILILLTLGLTFTSILGILYLLSSMKLVKLFYLSIYMVSPVVFGIGVDYSILILGRYLEERQKGRRLDMCLDIISRRTIPTILTCGFIVALGLGSFSLSRYPYIQVIGISFIIAVLMTLLTTCVVLPSIIRVLGDRILWPFGLETKVMEFRSKFLVKLAQLSTSKPIKIIIFFTILTILSTLCILLFMNVTTNPINLLPKTPAKIGYELLIQNFESKSLSEAYIVITPVNSKVTHEVTKYLEEKSYVVDVEFLGNYGNYSIIKVKLIYDSLADQLIDVYLDLRKYLNILEEKYNVKIYIGGAPANKYYFVKGFEREFYNFIVYLIMVLVILTLTLLIKSITIPLRLVITVLMSVSWAIAVTILLFEEIFHVQTYWLLPIILYTLLLSIGVDYDVFIISRFREEVLKGLNDREAIVKAIEVTGPIVTGAALILGLAFISLTLSSLYILKEIGFAIAIAVLMDAFIVRPFLVPAIIVLLGRYNWWPWRLR